MQNIKYSLLLLLGASSYGILASIVKLALGEGFEVNEVTGSQYLFGLFILLLFLPFIKRVKVSIKSAISLILVGMALSLTGILYGLSLKSNPASIAVVLLFQFTWIGVLMDALYEKTFPSRDKWISMAFLIGGTVLAGNLMPGNLESVETAGLIFGLLSAVSFATFIFAGGKVAKGVPSMQRSIYMTFGGLLLILLFFKPTFIIDGTIISGGLWKYAILTCFFGAIFPIVFFAIAAPKVNSGIATIIGSAELPAAILAATIVLGEKITSQQTLGIVLIIIGICVPQFHMIRSSRKVKTLKT